MEKEITIRKACEKDIPSLIQLLDEVLMVHHQGRPDVFQATQSKYTAEQLQEILKDDSYLVLVASQEDMVAGYAFCIRKQPTNSIHLVPRKELYLDDLCVEASYRKQGVGKLLFEAVQQHAKEEGMDVLTLHVWSFNESAKHFYEKCGMQPLFVSMEKKLK